MTKIEFQVNLVKALNELYNTYTEKETCYFYMSSYPGLLWFSASEEEPDYWPAIVDLIQNFVDTYGAKLGVKVSLNGNEMDVEIS